MDAKEVPARPNLEQYKKQAKDLVKIFKVFWAGDSEAIERVKKYHPGFAKLPDYEIASAGLALADAQLVIAREHGFESWPKFAKHIEALARARPVASLENPLAAFIEAACVPRDSGHASGTLEQAEAKPFFARFWPRIPALRRAISMRLQFWATMPACAGFWRSIRRTPL